MADKKTTQLDALTAVDYQDVLYIVDDPGGTPTSKKCTAQDLVKGGASQGALSALIDANLTPSKNLVSDTNGKITTTNYLFCRWRGSAASAPASPVDGDMYFNTGDSRVYFYANTSWRALS